MQTIQEDIDAIVPYSMHVSSRYLDLTKQKLELTRLPKENETLTQGEQWALGTPKSVLEPLLDHWYDLIPSPSVTIPINDAVKLMIPTGWKHTTGAPKNPSSAPRSRSSEP